MIVASRVTAQSPPRTPSREEILAPDEPITSHALVPVTPVERLALTPRLSRRASAPFLAQLIAAEQMHPQTRVHNRAEPRDVIAAYGNVLRMLQG
jgi:hypothetical protein